MKYLKYLAISLLSFSIVACSDDDAPVNTGTATVEFKDATVSYKENTSIVQLPIVLTGEHNGNVTVKATMKGNVGNFSLDKEVIITTETLVMPTGVETVNLEVNFNVANDAIEDGRSATFEITEVVGANVGANKTCTVEFKENNPLEGTYTVSGFSPFDGAIKSTKCNLIMEEGVTDKAYLDFGYGSLLLLNLEEVVAGSKYNVTIPGAQSIGTHPSYGNVFFKYFGVVGGQAWSSADDIKGVFENGVITLDTKVAYGFGIGVAAGWFEAYVAVTDEAGNLIPVTLKK